MNKLLLYTFIFLIAGIGIASAMTVSFSTPSAGGTLTGASQTITVAFTLGDSENVSIATLWYNNGTEKLLRLATNASANMTTPITFTVDTTTLLVDTATATLNITLTNSSGLGENTTFATLDVDVDNTVPTASRVELSPNFGERGSPITSRCFGSDAIDTSVSYSQTLSKSDRTVNTTRAGDSITWEGTLLLDLGNDYTVYCTVSDNAPLNATTTQAFSVQSEDDGARVITTKKKQEAIQQQTNNTNTFLLIGGGAVIIAIVIVSLVYMKPSKSSKKRRR